MKQLITNFRKAGLIALFLLFILGRSHAQLPCTLQTANTPSAADPMTWSLYAYLAGDSICSSFNTQYTWTIYGNPNVTLTGAQASHTFSSPGYYIVCVQAFYQGITASNCDTIFIQSGGTDCTPTFITNTQGLQASFSLAGSVPSSCFNGNTVYTWSFGDSTFATITGNAGTDHLYTTSGTYNVCVSAAAANGQVYSSCSAVTINANQGPFSLGGMVLANGTCLINESVMVEIYGIGNSYYQSMTINGGPDSCYYYFQTPLTTQPAQYIIRATPMTNPGYLPTYFGDVSFWGDATFITPNVSGWNYNINLIPVSGDSALSIGSVGGTISGNGVNVSTSINGNNLSIPFNVTACRVIILNAANQPIGFAIVNSDGTYSFSNLPAGNYTLRVEHPLVPSTETTFSISAASPAATAAFSATSTGLVVVTGRKNQISGEAGINLYPNPAGNMLSVTGGEGPYSILNVQGKKVAEGNAAEAIDIRSLPAGIYHLRIGHASLRFAKQD